MESNLGKVRYLLYLFPIWNYTPTVIRPPLLDSLGGSWYGPWPTQGLQVLLHKFLLPFLARNTSLQFVVLLTIPLLREQMSFVSRQSSDTAQNVATRLRRLSMHLAEAAASLCLGCWGKEGIGHKGKHETCVVHSAHMWEVRIVICVQCGNHTIIILFKYIIYIYN